MSVFLFFFFTKMFLLSRCHRNAARFLVQTKDPHVELNQQRGRRRAGGTRDGGGRGTRAGERGGWTGRRDRKRQERGTGVKAGGPSGGRGGTGMRRDGDKGQGTRDEGRGTRDGEGWGAGMDGEDGDWGRGGMGRYG